MTVCLRKPLWLYQNGRVTAMKASEILGVSLRNFLEILEKEGIPVNWDSAAIDDYLNAKYGE